ncbi:MAG TPA: fibronectin type III domain-containing protein [Candidatus Dojkabacteria bacterium]|nr:fibronectin type III domain-containing protein [Candidatus Dojkabacteria bacterium]
MVAMQLDTSFLKNNKKLLPLFIVGGVLLLGVIFLVLYWYVLGNVNPSYVRVTNQTDTSFTVSWVSTKKSKGQVLVREDGKFLPGILAPIGSDKFYDDRDVVKAELEAGEKRTDKASKEVEKSEDKVIDANKYNFDVKVRKQGRYYVHTVTVSNLDADTGYNFRIGNGFRWYGDEVLKDNSDSDLQYGALGNGVLETKTLPFPEDQEFVEPNPAYGGINIDENSDYNQVLVYGFFNDTQNVKNSLPVNTAPNETGGWYIDISNSRWASGYVWSGYNIETALLDMQFLYVQDGEVKQEYLIVALEDGFPIGDVYLGHNTNDSGESESKFLIQRAYALACVEEYPEACTCDNGASGNRICIKMGDNATGEAGASCPWGPGSGCGSCVCGAAPVSPPPFAPEPPPYVIPVSIPVGGVCPKDANGRYECSCSPFGANAPNNIGWGATCAGSDNCPCTLPDGSKVGAGLKAPDGPSVGGGEKKNPADDPTCGGNYQSPCDINTHQGRCDDGSSPFPEAPGILRCGKQVEIDVGLIDPKSDNGCGGSGQAPCDPATHSGTCDDGTAPTSQGGGLLCGTSPATTVDTCKGACLPGTVCETVISGAPGPIMVGPIPVGYTGGGTELGVCVPEINKPVADPAIVADANCSFNTREEDKLKCSMEAELEIFDDTCKLTGNGGVLKGAWNTIKCAGKAALHQMLPITETLIPGQRSSLFSPVSAEANNTYYTINDMGLYSMIVNGEVLTDIDVDREGYRVGFFIDKNGNEVFDAGDELVEASAIQIELKKESETFNYQLSEGYNYVSFPFVGDDKNNLKTMSSVLQYLNSKGIEATVMATYDGGWKAVDYREIASVDLGSKGQLYGVNDFPINPGRGYVIRVISGGGQVSLSGFKVAQPVPVEMKDAWNLIGVHGLSTYDGYTADDLIASMKSQDIPAEIATQWIRGRYESRIIKDVEGTERKFGNDFPIEEYKAYFVQVNGGTGVWEPEKKE